MNPPAIDHLVIAAATLADGVAWLLRCSLATATMPERVQAISQCMDSRKLSLESNEGVIEALCLITALPEYQLCGRSPHDRSAHGVLATDLHPQRHGARQPGRHDSGVHPGHRAGHGVAGRAQSGPRWRARRPRAGDRAAGRRQRRPEHRGALRQLGLLRRAPDDRHQGPRRHRQRPGGRGAGTGPQDRHRPAPIAPGLQGALRRRTARRAAGRRLSESQSQPLHKHGHLAHRAGRRQGRRLDRALLRQHLQRHAEAGGSHRHRAQCTARARRRRAEAGRIRERVALPLERAGSPRIAEGSVRHAQPHRRGWLRERRR